jgi:hypothetical protein
MPQPPQSKENLNKILTPLQQCSMQSLLAAFHKKNKSTSNTSNNKLFAPVTVYSQHEPATVGQVRRPPNRNPKFRKSIVHQHTRSDVAAKY